MKTALTIAGSDSGGGAGIQADLKTFSALGVYGMSALAAITAQNTVGVRAIFELPPDIVAAQIDAVVEDIGADAVKTGMLGSTPLIEVVADRIRAHSLRTLVVDPVMVAKSGDALLQPEAVAALRELLLPLALVVTPNRPEAEVLTGRPVATLEEARDAARALVALGARNAVVKGGHSEGPAIDVLFDGERFHEFSAPRLDSRHTHGTGCTFASAIAAELAKGATVPEAVGRAKEYLTAALERAPGLGHGHGPVHHFWALWKDAPRAAGETSIWARATGQSTPGAPPAPRRPEDLKYEELLRTVGQMLDDSGDDLAVLDLWSHGVVIQSVGRSGPHEIQLSEIELESRRRAQQRGQGGRQDPHSGPPRFEWVLRVVGAALDEAGGQSRYGLTVSRDRVSVEGAEGYHREFDAAELARLLGEAVQRRRTAPEG
ncbi:MAG TPA: bifunctional hydroxymethylpyrimidine kinase/phosphomethylpyrimidine kinase [Chloroflexota bacterium]|nr:bifunctional hydroxymethylpyrimidine kinase/phosphomethylpyrimidine kinase [Chloroflexota bacterium]